MRGLVPCGTTGEYYACSMEERLRILEHTRDVAAGRAQLIAGCNAGSTREAIAYGEAARDLGYDAMMLAAPPTSLPSQRELARATTRTVARRGRPAGRALQLPGPRRRRDRHRVPRRRGRPCPRSSPSRSRAATSRASSHLRRRYAGRIDDHVRLRRPGGRLLLVGRPLAGWPAPPNVLPRHHVAIMDAANAGDHGRPTGCSTASCRGSRTWRAGSYNQKAKLGLAHQGFDCGLRPPAAAAVSTDDAAAELLAVLDEALAVSLAHELMRVRATALTGVEVHAEGEQGTCYPRRSVRHPRRDDARQAAPHQRGRRLDPPVPVLRAARAPADEREPRVPVERSEAARRLHDPARPTARTR